MSSLNLKRFTAFMLLVFLLPCTFFAQTTLQDIKHKPKILKGEWQLVKTFTDSAFHIIDKDEYDAVIRIKSCHQFEEEVWYEGYHWIIKGQWHAKRKTDSLCFTKRTYSYGKLEDNPKDIRYVLSELTKQQWTGNSIAEGELVQLTYQRINVLSKRKKKVK